MNGTCIAMVTSAANAASEWCAFGAPSRSYLWGGLTVGPDRCQWAAPFGACGMRFWEQALGESDARVWHGGQVKAAVHD